MKYLGLPLLARELVELSARPRTYLVRVVYAAILLLICWIVLYSSISGAISPLDILGQGLVVMHTVGYLQDIGLQLVLPAIACEAFTIEKERNTLGLLFLTRLGPWTILFEKLLSRLLLALSFLIISWPVIGFCYALGGITIDDVLAQFLSVFVTAVYIVSFSILCSTWFRTTSGALLGAYALIYMARTTVVVFWSTLLEGEELSVETLLAVFAMGNIGDDAGRMTFGLGRLQMTALFSIPWLMVSGVSVLLSRWFLVRRAFLPSGNAVRRFFKRLDGLFDWANTVFARGVVVIRPSERQPGSHPVAWRETTTRLMGQERYLIRMLVVVEAPVVAMQLRFMALGDADSLKAFTFMTEIVIWIGMTLVTCVIGAGLISGERGRQTLDVLLATPLQGRDIVRQKMEGLRGLIWICQAPLWTCLLFRSVVEFDVWYVINKSSMLLIYPPAVAWIAMWHGLRAKTTVRAVVRSLLSILIRCLGTLILLYAALMFCMAFLWTSPWDDEELLESVFAFFTFVSPGMFFIVAEYWREMGTDGPWAFQAPVAVIVNSLLHGTIYYWIRSKCLNRADALLGRIRQVANGRKVTNQEVSTRFEADTSHAGISTVDGRE